MAVSTTTYMIMPITKQDLIQKQKKQVTEEGSRRTILQVHYREREREDKLLEKCYNTFVIACAATLAGDCSIDPHLCMQLLATLDA